MKLRKKLILLIGLLIISQIFVNVRISERNVNSIYLNINNKNYPIKGVLNVKNTIILENITSNGYAWNFMTQISNLENVSVISSIHDVQRKNFYHIFMARKEGVNGSIIHLFYYTFNYTIDSNEGIVYNLTLVSDVITNLADYVSAYGNIVLTKIIKARALYNGSYIFVIGVQIKTDGAINQVFTILAYKYNGVELKDQLINTDILTTTDARRILFDMVFFNNATYCIVGYIYQYDDRTNFIFRAILEVRDMQSGTSQTSYHQSIGELLYSYRLSNAILNGNIIRFLLIKINDERSVYEFYEARYNLSSGLVNDPWSEGYKFVGGDLKVSINGLISVQEYMFSDDNVSIYYIIRSEAEELFLSNIVNISQDYEFITEPQTIVGFELPRMLSILNTTIVTSVAYGLYFGSYNGEQNFYLIKIENGSILSAAKINTTLSTNVILQYYGMYNDSEGSILVTYIAYDKNGVKRAYLSLGLKDEDRDGLSDILEEIYYQTDSTKYDNDGDGLGDGTEILHYRTNATNRDSDGDGIDDYFEITHGYDPLNPDMDGDGIKDGDEVLSYKTSPLSIDSDNDGLNDTEEILIGYDVIIKFENGSMSLHVFTNASDPDSDHDNLPDAKEKALGTNPWSNDTDEDGLTDYEEVVIYNTLPNNFDSDEDGIPDGDEIKVYHTNPLDKDSDKDGLSDLDELGNNTLPNATDTDRDGVSDYEEIVVYKTDPLNNDTDGDGLTDGLEVFTYKSNVTNKDTDGDGLTDGLEVFAGLNPTVSDTDGDGLTDYEEVKVYNTNPKSIDTDGDGLTDYEEVKVYNTNPADNDTDRDGLSDYEEAKIYFTDPYKNDTDGDGLTDYEEVKVYNTNPKSIDTDGDGLTDYEEVRIKGTSPILGDTDGDGIPDDVDFNPTFNEFILVGLAICMLLFGGFVVYTKSAGTFRDWRKDVIILGLAEAGGTPMLALPEEEKTKHDPTVISSALYGMWSLVSEISGRPQEFLVFGGKPAMIISVKDDTVLWVIANRSYKKLEDAIKNLHKIILERYGEIIKSWEGLEDNLRPVKDFIMMQVFSEKMTGLEKIELTGEVEDEELEEEIKVEEEVLRELKGEEEEKGKK